MKKVAQQTKKNFNLKPKNKTLHKEKIKGDREEKD